MLKFKSRISKMGDNKIIWIPLSLHEMTGDLEKEGQITVTLEANREAARKRGTGGGNR